MIFSIDTHNAKCVEDIAKVVLKRYHLSGSGGTEHYNSVVEHSVDVLQIACTMVDTLASSYEHMPRHALLDKLVEQLRVIQGRRGAQADDRLHENDEGSSQETVCYVARFLAASIEEYMEGVDAVGVVKEAGAVCVQSRFREAFTRCMHDNHAGVNSRIINAECPATRWIHP